jgi:tRNA pseudouridine13 synthase
MIIKHTPEDFIVKEIPLKEWDDTGPYAVFRLTKIGLNTEQAIDIISKRFHIPSNIIKYSGTKDKHAHTTQYISIPTKPNIGKLYIDEENLKMAHVGFSDEPLSLGTLAGNRFMITLREISSESIAALRHKDLTRFLIPNYFDEQRFSSNNYNIGLHILKKDYKKATEYMCESSDIYADTARIYLAAHPNDYIGALKKIPKKTLLMFIHSVQSYIFNEALAKILIGDASSRNIESYAVAYSLGKLVFYDTVQEYDYVKETESLDLIGFDTHTINHHIKHILEEKGITLRDFIIRAIPDMSVEGTTRECFVEVKSLEVHMLEDRAIIEFDLPKGSYATIVVKALFNE